MKERNDNPDIFDRIMEWKVLKPFNPLCRRFKEQLLYLFFGGLTTILSIFLFWLFTVSFSIDALIANIICWIICVLFAYVTNRTWVFSTKARDTYGVIRECLSFFSGRLVTLALEELVLWIGIDILMINSMIVKVVAQIMVIIGNYVISKWLVFHKEVEIEREAKGK